MKARSSEQDGATADDGLAQVGRRIRAHRKLQRLRLLDLAKRAGCSESLLSRVETGRVLPSLSTLHRLSRALGVNVAVLMDESGDRTCTVYSHGERCVFR